MNANLSYTDLIYLVIDGEATDFERQSLYSAMANDNDLQIEFQAALKLNKANEVQPLVMSVPKDLTKSLFLAAGLTNTNLVLTNPTVQSTFASGLRLGVLLLTATLSAIATYGLMKLSDGNQNAAKIEQTSVASPQNGNGQLANSNIRHTPNNDNKINNSKPTNRRNNVAMVNSVEVPNKSNVVEVSNDKRNDEQYFERKNPSETKNIESLNSTQFVRINESNIAYDYSIPHYKIEDRILIQNVESNSTLSDFFVEYHGISGISYFPSRDINTSDNKLFNNMSLSLNYKLGSIVSLGADFGQETLPIYEVKTNDSLQKYESLMWAGGNISAKLYSIDNFDLKGKLIIGGTKLGSIIKPNLIIGYQLNERVSLNAGLEGTMLIYQYNTKILQTTKIAFVYGISIGL